jgi:hypothetical protein
MATGREAASLRAGRYYILPTWKKTFKPFGTSIRRSLALWMNILYPLVRIYVILFLSLLPACQLPFEKERQAEAKTELSQLTTDKIANVTVLLWACEGESPVVLKSEHWQGLIEQLQALQPTKNVSAKTTNIYRVIEIETTNRNKYRIFIGNAYKAARLVADVGPNWNGLYFEAADLWNWLYSIDAVKQQKKKEGPC